MSKYTVRLGQLICVVLATAGSAAAEDQRTPQIRKSTPQIEFSLSPTKLTNEALPNAWAKVKVTQHAEKQVLELSLGGLPPHVELELFSTETPEQPFGMSRYGGSVTTDEQGNAYAALVGRFNAFAFTVVTNEGELPSFFDDSKHIDKAVAARATKVGPIKTLHLGLWFKSLAAAADSGISSANELPCLNRHEAGPLAFSSSSFPTAQGPLAQLESR